MHELGELRLVDVAIVICVQLLEHLLKGVFHLGHKGDAHRLMHAGVPFQELDDAAAELGGLLEVDGLLVFALIQRLHDRLGFGAHGRLFLLGGPKEGLNLVLHLAVHSHEATVGAVPDEEQQCLPPLDLAGRAAREEDDDESEANDVESAVPSQRPPCENQHLFGGDRAHGDDEEHVEDSTAHDGREAHIALVEDGNKGREELWHAATSCHERGTGNVHVDFIVLNKRL
mmetsp:Transcript_18180/g.56243  ORF Transcript_18180/g.56243 Transcript_18180/m.56243 type:complete len:229 (+) Transcript_18180:407-1093(+)